jgi:hypothetical protein
MEVAASKVQLPSGLTGPFEVYVNGIRQQEGRDFTRRGDELVFAKELKREGKLGFWRWTSLFLGVAGTYRQNDSVDLVYEVDGKKVVQTGSPILTEEPIGTMGRPEE